jgi:hypothetical protein
MTNEEAKVFLDNLKVCINEHPVVADWLVEIADRKTEQTTEDCSMVEDEPQKKEVEWVYNKRERLWYPYSNGELLFKDEPTTQTETQNSNLTFEKADERCKGCNHYKLTCDLFSEICEYEPKDEPQMNPCDGCVCDDGKHLMYCMNCKGIAWKTEPPKVEDVPKAGMSDMSEIDKMIKMVDGILGDDDLCEGCEYVIEGLSCDECRRKYADKIIKILRNVKRKPQTERSE